jgi:hypothetical protein
LFRHLGGGGQQLVKLIQHLPAASRMRSTAGKIHLLGQRGGVHVLTASSGLLGITRHTNGFTIV